MDISAYAQFFTVILLFILVVGLTWLTTHYIAGYQKTHYRGMNIEPLETYRISQNQFVQILRIGSKYVAVAVSKDSVEKLCELSEDDFEKQETVSDKKVSFREMLEKMHPAADEHEKKAE